VFKGLTDVKEIFVKYFVLRVTFRVVVQPPKIRTKLQTIIKNKTSVLSLRWQG
jgi:hypothetical protein